MVTTATPAPETPAPMSAFGRIIGVLINPKPTFTDIARRPSWLLPIALLSILGLGVGALMNQRIDWGSYIRQQAEKDSRFAQLSEDQKQQRLGMGARIAPVSAYLFGFFGAGVFALILTLVYWGAFNLFAGAGLGFGGSFGTVSHAMVPSGLASLLALVTLYFKRFGEVDPEHMLATSVGAFLESDAPKWLKSLGGSLDLFWIWILVLLAVGFAAANPKKISAGKAFGVVLGLWLVWLVVKVGWAAAFS